jgi:hypothetical protein
MVIAHAILYSNNDGKPFELVVVDLVFEIVEFNPPI